MSTWDHPDWWKPVGGSNAQDSMLERRSLIYNDDEIEDGDVPDNYYEAPNYRGKFYTRGCRGMIEQIQLYCTGDGVDELIIQYSPHPCLGPYGQVTLTPAAGWAWQEVDIEKMWNYDSLFLWVYSVGANVDWAYDIEQPHDGHLSIDVGDTWSDLAIRPFLRIVYTGETPGDVPVSGIINNIRIPFVSPDEVHKTVLTVSGMEEMILGQYGAGVMVEARVIWKTSVAPTAGIRYLIQIFCDTFPDRSYMISNRYITQSLVATSGRCAVGEFFQDSDLDRTYMTVRVPLEFRRIIRLGCYQNTGGNIDATGRLYLNLCR